MQDGRAAEPGESPGIPLPDSPAAAAIALLDADARDTCIAGERYEDQGSLSPGNAPPVVAACIDNLGNSYLTGEVFESMW